MEPATLWATIGAAAGAGIIKVIDKWFKRTEQKEDALREDTIALHDGQVEELHRYQNKCRELELDLEKSRKAHWDAQERLLSQAAKIGEQYLIIEQQSRSLNELRNHLSPHPKPRKQLPGMTDGYADEPPGKD